MSELDSPTSRRIFSTMSGPGPGVAILRTAPTPLFQALLVRDGHCRHPDCDRPGDECQAHPDRCCSHNLLLSRLMIRTTGAGAA